MTDEKVIAPGAICVLQAAGYWINACSVTIGLFRHPAAFWAMHEPTLVTNQKDRWLPMR